MLNNPCSNQINIIPVNSLPLTMPITSKVNTFINKATV